MIAVGRPVRMKADPWGGPRMVVERIVWSYAVLGWVNSKGEERHVSASLESLVEMEHFEQILENRRVVFERPVGSGPDDWREMTVHANAPPPQQLPEPAFGSDGTFLHLPTGDPLQQLSQMSKDGHN